MSSIRWAESVEKLEVELEGKKVEFELNRKSEDYW